VTARPRPAAGSSTASTQRRLRSVAFVAEYLAVDHTTVRRWIDRGDLRAYRLGSGPKAILRLDLNEVEAFVRPVEVSA
jgi:excisionase family DNA binding protein